MQGPPRDQGAGAETLARAPSACAMTPLRDVVMSDVERACNRGLLSGGPNISGRDMTCKRWERKA